MSNIPKPLNVRVSFVLPNGKPVDVRSARLLAAHIDLNADKYRFLRQDNKTKLYFLQTESLLDENATATARPLSKRDAIAFFNGAGFKTSAKKAFGEC